MHPLDAEFEKYWAELEPKLKATMREFDAELWKKACGLVFAKGCCVGVDEFVKQLKTPAQPKEQTKEAA